MEQDGIFRLRVAPTLAQGEEEMAARMPDYVFVENQISGLAGGIIVGYLRSLLPEEAGVVLMARNAADAGEIHQGAGLRLDLSEGDEALQRSIRDAIPVDAEPQSPQHADPPPLPPKAARELLFDGPGREGGAGGEKRPFWLIPLALAVLCLFVTAYLAGKMAPHAPAQNAGAVASHLGGARSGGAQPGPAALRRIGKQAAEKSSDQSGEAAASSDRYLHYVVQPGDSLLKILVRDFGFSHAAFKLIIPELKRLNNMSVLDRLKPGQRLIIPVPQQQRNETK
jgi:hypothetical protein